MQNHGGNPKKVNNIFEKQLRFLWSCQFPRHGKYRNQPHELTILTHTADEPIGTTNQWHTIHKVNCPPLEFVVWQWQWLQKASRYGVDIFDVLANSAALDKCSNMLRQLGPLEALLQHSNGFPCTRVRRIQWTVQFQHNMQAQPI